MSDASCPYLPSKAVIHSVTEFTRNDRLFEFVLTDADLKECKPGQFVQLWIPGVGECPISICSVSGQDKLQLCVRRVGRVTSALFALHRGDTVGLRGPYGCGFPMEGMTGRNLILIAGGLGIAPVRSVWQHVLQHRGDYGRVIVVYGARRQKDLLFTEELDALQCQRQIEINIAAEEMEIKDYCELPILKGVITKPLRSATIDSSFDAVVCGPPAMYKYVVQELQSKGLTSDHIFLSLERHMKCGTGKCGHCFIGGRSTCQSGPVFSLEDLTDWPEAMECA